MFPPKAVSFATALACSVALNKGVFQDSTFDLVKSADFAVDFLAVRPEIGSETLGVAAVGVSAALVVRVNPGLDTGVFHVPVPERATEADAVAGDSYGGSPLVAPPAIIEHARR